MRGGPTNSRPNRSPTRRSIATSAGTFGGRPSSSAGRPAATKYSSKPPGTQIDSSLTGTSPSTTNVCGTPRGRNVKEPGPAVNVRSPQRTVSVPSSTQNASSSRRWTCSGGEEPAGPTASTRPNAPPVIAAVALIVMRFWVNHTASPASAAMFVPSTLVSISVIVVIGRSLSYELDDVLVMRLESHYGMNVSSQP